MLLILILFVFPMRRHFCLHSLSHRRLICLLFGGKGESYGRNVIGNWTTLQFFNVIKRTMVFSELFALSFSFSIFFFPHFIRQLKLTVRQTLITAFTPQ